MAEARVVVTSESADVVRNDELRPLHEWWCTRNHEAPAGHWKQVAARMERGGAVADRDRRGRFWRGVRLEGVTGVTALPFSAPQRLSTGGNRNTRHTRHGPGHESDAPALDDTDLARQVEEDLSEAEAVDRVLKAFPGAQVVGL